MPSRRPSARLLALALTATIGGLGVTACSSDDDSPDPTTTVPGPGGATGTPVGNDAVDAVLALLEAPTDQPYTATYALLLRLGNVDSTGTVAADGSGARSVTVGDIRFVVGSEGDARTCRVSDGECEDGLLDARTSDRGFGSGFAADVPARRLRVAWSRRSGDPTGSTETIGGQPATCVSVPLGDGAESYCAIDAGLLARWTAADVVVDLESFADTADPALFAP